MSCLNLLILVDEWIKARQGFNPIHLHYRVTNENRRRVTITIVRLRVSWASLRNHSASRQCRHRHPRRYLVLRRVDILTRFVSVR